MSVASQKTRIIVSLALVNGTNAPVYALLYWEASILSCHGSSCSCSNVSLEKPTPTSKSVSFLFLGAELKKMGNSNDSSFIRMSIPHNRSL